MADVVDAAPTADRPAPRLIGRDRERERLHAWLAAALTGQGRLVLVSGEAGIGKTTLVADLAVQAEEAGSLVLWGHAYDLTTTPPYGPWVELARSYQPIDALPPFPALLNDPQALAAVGSQEALIAQTWDFFASVAATRPLVLLLEDLHWADQESLALLRFVARQVSRHRVLVLATYRSDELTRRHPLYQQIPLLIREAGAERLDVRPLDKAATRTLITRRFPLLPADVARLEAYLAERAEGNPLYAEELLRTLEDDRVLVGQDGACRLGDLERLRVPPLLMQVIEARLGRLRDETRRLLEIAAVIGQEVALELWQPISGASDDALAAAIEVGSEAHLLGDGPGGAIRFSHALVREALYQGIVLVRRRAWHRQVGEALAARPSPDPDTVAHHFEEAGDARVTDWLLRAGERAQRAYSWVTAAERFDAALAKRTEQGARASERVALLWRVALLLRLVDTRRALALMDEGRALAQDAGEAGQASLSQFMAGLYRCSQGDVRAGLVDMEQGAAAFDALDAAEQARCRALMSGGGRLVGTLVLWLTNTGRLPEAHARGRRMVAEVRDPEFRPGQVGNGDADGLWGFANAEALLGQPGAARHLYQLAHTGYRTIEHYNNLADIRGAELKFVQLPYFPDDLAGRRQLAVAAEEYGRRAQAANAALPERSNSVPLLVLEGDWAEAQEVASRAYKSTNLVSRWNAGPWLAAVARDQGDLALARRIVAEALPDGPATEPGNTLIWAALSLQRLAAGLALGAGDLPAARAPGWRRTTAGLNGPAPSSAGPKAPSAGLNATTPTVTGLWPASGPRRHWHTPLSPASLSRSSPSSASSERSMLKTATSPRPRHIYRGRSPWPAPAPRLSSRR